MTEKIIFINATINKTANMSFEKLKTYHKSKLQKVQNSKNIKIQKAKV